MTPIWILGLSIFPTAVLVWPSGGSAVALTLGAGLLLSLAALLAVRERTVSAHPPRRQIYAQSADRHLSNAA